MAIFQHNSLGRIQCYLPVHSKIQSSSNFFHIFHWFHSFIVPHGRPLSWSIYILIVSSRSVFEKYVDSCILPITSSPGDFFSSSFNIYIIYDNCSILGEWTGGRRIIFLCNQTVSESMMKMVSNPFRLNHNKWLK